MKIQNFTLLFQVILLFFCQLGYSQVPDDNNKIGFTAKHYADISNQGATLTALERKALFNKEFTSALSDISSNYIGNFASLNIGATKASFATTFVRDGSIFGLNFSGATSDGTLKFINNNKLNYNINLGFQYHFIDHSKKIKFAIDVEDWKLKRMQRKKLIDDSHKKQEALLKGSNTKALILKKKAIKAKIDDITQKIDYIQSSMLSKSIDKDLLELKIGSIKQRLLDLKDYQDFNNGINTKYKTRKDKELKKFENCFSEKCIDDKMALKNDIAVKKTLLNKSKLDKQLDDLNIKFTAFKILKDQSKLIVEKTKLEAQLENLNEEIKYNDSNKILLASVEATKLQVALSKHDRTAVQTYGSQFNWFSIGAKVGLKSFILYDSNAIEEEQVTPKENYNLELTLQYSWHSYNELEQWKSYLLNIGSVITYSDNLNTLKGVTLTDETIISNSNNVIRSTKKETNVYVGEYMDDITGLKIYADLYYFLFKGNVAALHLFPTANFSQVQKPLFKTQIGIIFSYKDKDKPGAIVNAELFYSLNDLGNRADSNLNFLGRNTLGLRLIVPIKFKYQL